MIVVGCLFDKLKESYRTSFARSLLNLCTKDVKIWS